MPDRKFAASFHDHGTSGFVIELVPRRDLETLAGKKIVMQIKDGATREQVDKLQSMINLLGIDLRLESNNGST